MLLTKVAGDYFFRTQCTLLHLVWYSYAKRNSEYVSGSFTFHVIARAYDNKVVSVIIVKCCQVQDFFMTTTVWPLTVNVMILSKSIAGGMLKSKTKYCMTKITHVDMYSTLKFVRSCYSHKNSQIHKIKENRKIRLQFGKQIDCDNESD